MNTRVICLSAALAAAVFSSCSLLLDFDKTEDLPCPCDQEHVCLVPSDTCVRRASVETYKSCDLGADRPDDLCAPGEICESINGLGRRCLPMCKVSNYATRTAADRLAFECGAGKTCWESERGTGVCSEGICSELRSNDCPPPQLCQEFNGAGVCFTPCRIFIDNPACAGGQICQPIGIGSITACVKSGGGNIGDVCTDEKMCAPNQAGRPLVCDEVEGSGAPNIHCRALCECTLNPSGDYVCSNTRCNSGAACVATRPEVDTERHVGLGICLE